MRASNSTQGDRKLIFFVVVTLVTGKVQKYINGVHAIYGSGLECLASVIMLAACPGRATEALIH